MAEADKRHHGHGFSGTAFAHNAKQFTRFQVKTDIVDRVNLPTSGFENGFEVLDIKDGGLCPI